MRDGPVTFTEGEFFTVMVAILIPSLLFLGGGLWLKISGLRQQKEAERREEAEKTIFQRGDADIVSDGSRNKRD